MQQKMYYLGPVETTKILLQCLYQGLTWDNSTGEIRIRI